MAYICSLGNKNFIESIKMAKQQTFGDKVKKKKGDSRIHVKVIYSFKNESGNLRFNEKQVTVDDLNQLDKVAIN